MFIINILLNLSCNHNNHRLDSFTQNLSWCSMCNNIRTG